MSAYFSDGCFRRAITCVMFFHAIPEGMVFCFGELDFEDFLLLIFAVAALILLMGLVIRGLGVNFLSTGVSTVLMGC
jgi:hypothetical protein